MEPQLRRREAGADGRRPSTCSAARAAAAACLARRPQAARLSDAQQFLLALLSALWAASSYASFSGFVCFLLTTALFILWRRSRAQPCTVTAL